METIQETIHSKNWFLSRQGQKVYRSSTCFEGIVYKIFFPKPKRVKQLVPKLNKKGKNIAYKKGEKKKYKTVWSPSKEACVKDSLRQFKTQDEGYRFFDSKPRGMKLNKFEI